MTKKGDLITTPLRFSMVSEGIFRSSYPAPVTYPFLETLHLRTLVCLQPEDLRKELRDYCEEKGIEIVEAMVGINQEPFLFMNDVVVRGAIAKVLDPASHPVMFFCSNGRLRTSCVTGCIRKVNKWCLTSILAEFDQFVDDEGGVMDYRFIEAFRYVIQSKPITSVQI